jgi:hypothetical protein
LHYNCLLKILKWKNKNIFVGYAIKGTAIEDSSPAIVRALFHTFIKGALMNGLLSNMIRTNL